MSFDKNGHPCAHDVTVIDEDTGEESCVECGDVIDPEDNGDFPF